MPTVREPISTEIKVRLPTEMLEVTRFDKVYWTTWLAIDFLAFGLYWPAF
jgi:hypothetical protein